MMITKITNTPNYIYKAAQPQPKDYKLHDTPKPDPQPVSDTITFTSKASKTRDLVDMAFNKLAQTRKGKDLGNYIGTFGKTNVHLRETEFGKKAQLTIIRNQEFASFELSRASNTQTSIKPTDKENASDNVLSIVNRYLKLLK